MLSADIFIETNILLNSANLCKWLFSGAVIESDSRLLISSILSGAGELHKLIPVWAWTWWHLLSCFCRDIICCRRYGMCVYSRTVSLRNTINRVFTLILHLRIGSYYWSHAFPLIFVCTVLMFRLNQYLAIKLECSTQRVKYFVRQGQYVVINDVYFLHSLSLTTTGYQDSRPSMWFSLSKHHFQFQTLM